MPVPANHPAQPRLAEIFLKDMFAAKAVEKGGVIRRSVRVVEDRIGRRALIDEVERRGFHIVECGGQFIVLCNTGQMKMIR